MSGELIEHLRDLFAPLGPVSTRTMFGGCGLYLDGRIVGIVFDGMLYLKTDAATRDLFQAAGGRPLVRPVRGTPQALSYWSPPGEAMDSPAAMRPWALRAIEAARRGTSRRRRGS